MIGATSIMTRRIPRRISKASLTLFFVLLAGTSHPQSNSLILDEIKAARENSRRLGPFWVIPQFRFSSGYDTNASFSSLLPVADVTMVGTAGAYAALPVKKKFLFTFYNRLDALYYRNLEELRDVFGLSRADMTFGGKNFLARAGAEFRSERIRPPNEFDLLFDQDVRQITAAMDFRPGRRHKLSLEILNRKVDVQDVGVQGIEVKNLLDRSEQAIQLRFLKRLNPRNSIMIRAGRQAIDFTGELNRGDAVSSEAIVRLSFSPGDRLTGRAQVGYKQIVPQEGPGSDFRGWVGAATLSTRAGKRLRIGGEISRNAYPSVLGPNRFFVSRFVAGFAEYFLGKQFSIRPAVLFQYNQFSEPVVFPGLGGQVSEPVQQGIHQFSVDWWYRLTVPWKMGVRLLYSDQDSNIPYLKRDRFLVNFIFSTKL